MRRRQVRFSALAVGALAFAAAVPDAKLIVLPGVGHIVQNAAPQLVAREIDTMIGKIVRGTVAAAAN